MGGDADRRPVHLGAVLRDDSECIWPLFQNVYVHRTCAGSALRLCRRAYAEHRKELPKKLCVVCLEGAIIVLACIIFSVFASSPPVVDPNAAPASMVWSYIGELIFNMLILVGAVKMADRLVKEMVGI